MKKSVAQIIQEQGYLEGIKTQEDLSELLKELHSDLLEAMLQGELEAHLGYSKNEKSDNSNARNGTTSKRLKSEYGESAIEVPRDREGSFEPIIVPKHQSKSVSVENMVISLYAKGLSVSDIEQELYELYGYKLSTSAISIITDKVNS
ncbi:transposase [Empedobacter stercoris]|uniref:transposase n=1 Tax=Empedobacter stercoris TaxID=1628248 RepID=UPI0039E8A0B3